MSDLKAVLLTNSDEKVLVFSDFSVAGKDSFKSLVSLKSGGFSYNGYLVFNCYSSFLDDLEKMESDLLGDTRLEEEYHENYIKFEINRLGQVLVSGFIVEYGEISQNMHFAFKTDQTCLKSFINSFKIALSRA